MTDYKKYSQVHSRPPTNRIDQPSAPCTQDFQTKVSDNTSQPYTSPKNNTASDSKAQAATTVTPTAHPCLLYDIDEASEPHGSRDRSHTPVPIPSTQRNISHTTPAPPLATGTEFSNPHSNTGARAAPKYTGPHSEHLLPIAAHQKAPQIVNKPPGGIATSTPIKCSSPLRHFSSLVSHNLSPIGSSHDNPDSAPELPYSGNHQELPLNDFPAHLNESVHDVLDQSVQQAIPHAHPCGPTPHEFRHTLDTIWPVVSGSGWDRHRDYSRIYDAVRHTALPNFLAARVPVPSCLNIEAWRQRLQGYHDQDLIEFLQYGFPSNYSRSTPPKPTFRNHKEKGDYSQFVREYVVEECRLGTLLGPFGVPPFTPWCQCSPMMTRAKSTPGKRRIIVDLSFPKGASVNSGIPRREYLGLHHSYSLPSVSRVGDRLRLLGRGAYVWSVDVSRAYRQLRADPLSVPLFGITLDGAAYADTALPFGCRSSGAACVRVTTAVGWMLTQAGYHVEVYVDDFLGAEESYTVARRGFDFIISLCEELGLDLATAKCCPPSIQVIWLGFFIDSGNMSISIPGDKLESVLWECQAWLKRPRATKKALQQLVGKLAHLCSGIPHGRRFISRILSTLGRAHYQAIVEVDPEMCKDVRWFCEYARRSNGIYLIPPMDLTPWQIECDSCMSGGGAYSPKQYYAEGYDQEFTSRFTTIHALEAVNLVEAVAILRPASGLGMQVIVNTDNQASACTLETGRGSDEALCMCSRELWLLAALFGFGLEIRHKPGRDLVLADALSRAHKDPELAAEAARRCARLGLSQVSVHHSITRFSTNL